MESLPKNNSLTPSQQRAVVARGNVLVMAGAGTGKTKTLIARCLDCLERDGVAIDELLIVTFTEAAAAEIRQRLRKSLEEKIAAQPDESFWHEQIARFDLAHIGTLHSFCLKLVREHFYELGLDPRLAVLDEGEARQLANETLDDQFQLHYAGENKFSRAVQNLIQIHGGGRDENIRKLVLRLHDYSQARPDAAGWLARQREKFSAAEPADWQRWLLEAIQDWRDEWLPVLKNLHSGNEKAAELTGILSGLKKNFTREFSVEVLEQIISADGNWPYGTKKFRKPVEDFFDEAQFLLDLAALQNGADPLAEDWSWIREQMETLLRLAEEFAQKLADRKRNDGALDFHDLEQFALKLLWNFSTGQPSSVAATWREKLKFIFVDEYQDINAAQDKIIAALSRDGAGANRFLVGDVKQSIYRFRLADPKIFRDYAKSWQGKNGKTIPLSENFRSAESLLDFVNSLFAPLMRAEIGGVNYDEDARLKFGSQIDSRAQKNSPPRTELLLRFKTAGPGSRTDADDELADLGDAQKEARLVAARLRKFVGLEENKICIDENGKKIFRPAQWRDIAILLRSPRGKSEIFAKEFERAGIPLAVARGGFYENAEILDLLSLLQLLDNPLQDVPCIAVLRSPLVGLSLDELAEIRLAARDKHFWTALNHWGKAESGKRKAENQSLTAKVEKFLGRFSAWRKLAKQNSLSQCLEEILAETHYDDWLRAQSRGAQRAANLASFLQLAQSFDQFQQQGLFRFLKFIAAQQENEVEPEIPAVATENAVRLMSIHQSKGLEFPVVVLADLAKNFNEQDLRGEIIFDEEFGLCPKIKPPHAGGRYPSLPHWLAQRRQKRELRGEELRLLYVALTRARDHLILTACVREKNWKEKWNQPQPLAVQNIASAKSFADWLSLWFSNQIQSPKSKVHGERQGEFENLRWEITDDSELAEAFEIPILKPEALPALDEAATKRLSAVLDWKYKFEPATRRTAKSSVTTLRREAEELDDEAEKTFPVPRFQFSEKRATKLGNKKLSASEVGAAHHKFLEHFDFEKIDLMAEADRLMLENYLSADERAVLDLAALGEFWNSSLGKKIVAHAASVRRELPFTARFSPAEIAGITGAQIESGLENEFVVVQGVADLAVILPDEIWLVDFKTDEAGKNDLAEKIRIYQPQLQLYAGALEKIFARKVTLRALHFLATGKTVEI